MAWSNGGLARRRISVLWIDRTDCVTYNESIMNVLLRFLLVCVLCISVPEYALATVEAARGSDEICLMQSCAMTMMQDGATRHTNAGHARQHHATTCAYCKVCSASAAWQPAVPVPAGVLTACIRITSPGLSQPRLSQDPEGFWRPPRRS